MSTPNKIDFSKFKIEVYTPEGKYIKDAHINDSYFFFCEDLTVGQEYNVLFIYDNILVLSVSFLCNDTTKVMYLSPQHFLHNNGFSELTYSGGSDLAQRMSGLGSLDKFYQLWEKLVLKNRNKSSYSKDTIKIPAKRVVKFKAGNELATKVK